SQTSPPRTTTTSARRSRGGRGGAPDAGDAGGRRGEGASGTHSRNSAEATGDGDVEDGLLARQQHHRVVVVLEARQDAGYEAEEVVPVAVAVGGVGLVEEGAVGLGVGRARREVERLGAVRGVGVAPVHDV